MIARPSIHQPGYVVMVLLLVSALQLPGAFAASPVDVYSFENEQQSQRYRQLIDELRCPKCLNTNIAGSDAPIAQDLRAAVHRMIVTEKLSDEEILSFMQERYGDFVLYDPPFASRTLWLWLLPALVACLIVWVLIGLKTRHRANTPEMDEEEKRRLQSLLEDQA